VIFGFTAPPGDYSTRRVTGLTLLGAVDALLVDVYPY
jgi:hypothetical protein